MKRVSSRHFFFVIFKTRDSLCGGGQRDKASALKTEIVQRPVNAAQFVRDLNNDKRCDAKS